MIKKRVSGILGFVVQDWTQAWNDAEAQGKMTGAKTNQILRVLCEEVEKLQDELPHTESTD